MRGTRDFLPFASPHYSCWHPDVRSVLDFHLRKIGNKIECQESPAEDPELTIPFARPKVWRQVLRQRCTLSHIRNKACGEVTDLGFVLIGDLPNGASYES